MAKIGCCTLRTPERLPCLVDLLSKSWAQNDALWYAMIIETNDRPGWLWCLICLPAPSCPCIQPALRRKIQKESERLYQLQTPNESPLHADPRPRHTHPTAQHRLLSEVNQNNHDDKHKPLPNFTPFYPRVVVTTPRKVAPANCQEEPPAVSMLTKVPGVRWLEDQWIWELSFLAINFNVLHGHCDTVSHGRMVQK